MFKNIIYIILVLLFILGLILLRRNRYEGNNVNNF